MKDPKSYRYKIMYRFKISQHYNETNRLGHGVEGKIWIISVGVSFLNSIGSVFPSLKKAEKGE